MEMSNPIVAPFVKWAGGKRQLLPLYGTLKRPFPLTRYKPLKQCLFINTNNAASSTSYSATAGGFYFFGQPIRAFKSSIF